MKRSILRAEAVLLVVVLFVALQLVSDRLLGSARADLTEAGLFTLTEGSKHIAAELDEPVRMEFFFSDSLGNDVLRLTNSTGQSGSAFSTSAVSLDANASFSTAFRFHFSD